MMRLARRLSMSQRVTSLVTAIACLAAQLACPPSAHANHLGSTTASAGSALPPSMAATQSFQPDLFTGRATTAVPIVVPPGRHGMQPSLALQYSSTTPNGWLGVGWGLDLGYIELSTKPGVPKYNGSDPVSVVFQGVVSDLVEVPGGTWRAKDESLFLRFQPLASGWDVRDKSGTRYLFGTDATSTIMTPDGNVFRWALSQVIDPDGNSLSLTYQSDQGQIYVSRIDYTAHQATGLTATNQVTFLLEPGARPDPVTSYRSGFPITTAKRLQAIEVRTLGTLVRRYELAYALSRRTNRSLLTSVTQIGSDGTTRLPSTGFTYQDSQPVTYALTASTGAAKASLLGDVDGDGVSDWLLYSAGTWTVSLSQGSSFGTPTDWFAPPEAPSTIPLLGDFNGDGRTDTAVFDGSWWRFALSTGLEFLGNQLAAVALGNGTPLVGDFNGDRLTDLGTYNAGAWQIGLGTGHDFFTATPFSQSLGSSSSAPLIGDFNGDGLTDIGVADGGTVTLALSNGTRFVTPVAYTTGLGSAPAMAADLDGDGLTDLAVYDKTTGRVRYAASTGAGFRAPVELPVTFSLRAASDTLQIADINGDGLADPAVFNDTTGASEVARSSGGAPDLLVAIDNGVGGVTAIDYQSSTQVTLARPAGTLPQLPFAIPLVSRVTVQDGRGNSYATTYTYMQGLYDAATKEFRGFGHVETRDPLDTVASTDFDQDQFKGRPTQTEVRDAGGARWTRTVQNWSARDINPGERFIRLDQVQQSVCDAQASCKTTQTRWVYDDYGNVTDTFDDGDVDAPGLKRQTTTAYVYNPTAWIVSKPQLVQTLDVSGPTPVVLTQRRFYYDNATQTSTLPTVGNLTKEEEWLDTTTTWLPTTLAYDAYGNVTTITDARSNTTTTTYDATNTYVAQITNAASQTRQFTYDARFGKVASTTDQNGQLTTTSYDVFGRIAAVVGPLDTPTMPTTTYSYQLGSPISSTATCQRVQSGQASMVCSRVFTDGLGRTIQVRSPAQDTSKDVVTGEVEFNARGLVAKQWAPYLDATSTVYRPRPASGLAPPVLDDYDPVGRLIKTTDPDNSITQTIYDRWSVTTIDAEGHQARRTQDAFGRLATIEELNDTGTVYATTRYGYDALNRLTQVTDAKNNVTRLTYDSLGRKRTMTDPDMGAWSYAYDAVNNLTTQTDARGVVTTFTYDTLNRLTGKTYTVPTGVPNPGAVVYTYDGTDDVTKLYAKGRLTKVTDGSGWTSFFYDQLGRVVKETKQIDTTYTTQRSYDLLDRVTSLTYPVDGEVATYTYNQQGGIDTVKLGAQTIVSSATYNAAGQMTRMVYGNGVSTDYTYDLQTLRLKTLVSQTPTATLQNFTYTFDRVGNVKTIGDAVYTGTQAFGYDAQNRLTSASGSYGSQIYQYDELGNLLRNEGLQLSYPAAGSARPHATTGASGDATISLTYDANGTVATKTVDGVTQTFTFDAENRLSETHKGATEQVTLTFQPGWNFFSLPLVPSNLTITSVFPTFAADFEQVAQFNPSTGKFTHYVGSVGFDDFTALQYGVGYQVYCKNPSGATVTITGSRATSLAPALAVGWQLLPAVTLERATLPQIFGSVDYSDARAYSGSLQLATDVVPGQAYYVKLRTAGTWRPPLPTSSVAFVYDGDGGRVKTTTSLGPTIYLGELLEKAPTGVTTKYIFAGSQRVASKTSTGQLLWTLPDHLGSSHVVTDATGARVELTEYRPFGGLSRNEGPAEPAHHFTGQRQGELPDLIVFPGRVYDTQLGRFLQADPIVQAPDDPQSLNRYTYCRNNPLNLTDPSGYSFWKKFFTIVGIVATVVAAVATAGASLGIEGAIGVAIQAAGTAVGSFVSANQLGQSAEAAPLPSATSATNNPTPSSTGTPFIPAAPPLGPLADPIPERSPMPLGDPRPERTPPVFGDPLPDRLPIGWIIDTALELGQMYNALKASETPKPTNDVGETPQPADQGKGKRNTPDQQAVIELAKEAKRRGGITPAEAEVLKQLAKEAGVPFRGPQSHPKRPHGRKTHIHVGPVDHILVR